MSEPQPKLSSAKVTFAILGAIALLFIGCVQISTEGRVFDVKGNNELFGGLCLLAGAALAFWLYRIAFKSKPSFALHHDRLEFYCWSQPVHFRDIDEIVFEPGQFWMKRAPLLALRLKTGSIQHLPYGLMTHGPDSFAELLTAALQDYRDRAKSDRDASAAAVTGP
ncbi:MAG: hypothetical protein A2623_04635 [Caulobacterales bacterium RIFCSPHIGHO2_01_FULL_70_19]|nr:MAG: hypothetical protein A2623_04635 [Caulobacterales bacterium RIFCSPHIGHO2_01_FULL_70_19]